MIERCAAIGLPSLGRAMLKPYQLTLVLAVVAAVLAYYVTTLPPLAFDSGDHSCDGPNPCEPKSFFWVWVVHWAMIAIVLSPIALWHVERHGRNAAAWSLIALAGLPATIWAILLGNFVVDAKEISFAFVVEATFFAGVPLALFAAAIWRTARSLLGGARLPPGTRIPGLVAAGYAYIIAALAFLFGLPL